MKLVDLIRPELVIPELAGRSKAQVLAEFSRHLAKTQPGLDAALLNRILTEREQLATTAIGEDIAIPHGKIEGATRMIGCVGRSTPGIAFDSLDGKPTHLFCATAEGPGLDLKDATRTWNTVIPLAGSL
jgi:PTS system nitrogen regulatory IIA component